MEYYMKSILPCLIAGNVGVNACIMLMGNVLLVVVLYVFTVT
jgi:hypothetical protein